MAFFFQNKRLRLRHVALALGLAVAALPLLSAVQAQEQSSTFTLDQARDLAEKALRRGDLDTARTLAMGLVKADPKDAHAYAVLAAVHSKMNNPDLARAAARLSYKHSPSRTQSYHAAHTAGRIAYQQKRFNAAQFWLRRAATHADGDQKVSRLGQDYAHIKRANPLGFRLNLSLAPSDNVNNGSDATLLSVNGEPLLGPFGHLGTGSRALSGMVGTADLNLRYRLKSSSRGQTNITARLYTRQVALSSASEAAIANDPAATLSNSDLSSTSVEFGLSRAFSLKTKGNFATVTGTVGRAWSGGDARYNLARLQFSPNYALSKTTRLSLSASVEKRFSTETTDKDQVITQLRATLSHALGGGDKLSLGVNLQNVASAATNGAYHSGNVQATYSFGKKIGPMRLSTGVTLGQTNYNDYTIFGPVAGGRQDLSLYGDVTMMFTDYDYAGFAPTVRIRAGRKSSNISRFDTRELSVSLGIQSTF